MWMLDSGASDHMSGRLEWFFDYKPLENPIQVAIGNDTILLAKGRGKINITTCINGKDNKHFFNNVLYVPDLKFNLFSCTAIIDKGFTMLTNSKECVFKRDGKIVCIGDRNGKLFNLRFRAIVPGPYSHHAHVAVKNTIALWHERLLHQNIR